MIRKQVTHYSVTLLLMLLSNTGRAASLSHPDVDSYNVAVGTQTFAGLYQFTTNTLLVETAEAIRALGSDIIKLYLGPDFPRQYRIKLPPAITSLATLARNEPSCQKVLDMPFHHIIAWTYPLKSCWPFDGYSAVERTNEYREVYDLTKYLLTQFNNSGKTFYLGHWEGDWYLLPKYNTHTNPTRMAIQGMIDWLNNRQKAIDDAKSDSLFTNVNVFHYAEVNRVLDARSSDPSRNQRVINRVVPAVPELDCLSWSAYDGMNLSGAELPATLDYLSSMLPTNKAATVPGPRVWVGEYGWGAETPDKQEPLTRSFLQKVLPWGPRFVLFWEIYNNEPERHFCLIDPHNQKVESWHLHHRFNNAARLFVAQFRQQHGRLPLPSEFGTAMVPILGRPLDKPLPIAVTNSAASWIRNSGLQVSGTVAQGIYGDECATVRVFWGSRDGGTSGERWGQNQVVSLNTNFGPVKLSVVLSNIPDSEIWFRFYGSNGMAEVWAAESMQVNRQGR
jgi:hypothetical protein